MEDADVLVAVRSHYGAAEETVRFVHEHPELAYEEYACAEHLAGVLDRALEVERGLADMPTGFRARLDGGRDGRAVGIVAVYDAVAVRRDDGSLEPVHSCGHGPICGAVVAASLGLASLRAQLRGALVVYGCPADETASPGTVAHGGKSRSAAAGAWRGIAAALFAHPESHDAVFESSPWMRRYRAVLAGRHDAAEWQLPVDRVRLERLQVGEDGGERTRVSFRVIGPDETSLEERADELRAALQPLEWEAGRTTAGLRTDERVAEAARDAYRTIGREPFPDPPQLPFSNDFGDVCRTVPGALIGVTRPGGWALHTDEGAAQFRTPEATTCMQAMAEILALTAVRLQSA